MRPNFAANRTQSFALFFPMFPMIIPFLSHS